MIHLNVSSNGLYTRICVFWEKWWSTLRSAIGVPYFRHQNAKNVMGKWQTTGIEPEWQRTKSVTSQRGACHCINRLEVQGIKSKAKQGIKHMSIFFGHLCKNWDDPTYMSFWEKNERDHIITLYVYSYTCVCISIIYMYVYIYINICVYIIIL